MAVTLTITALYNFGQGSIYVGKATVSGNYSTGGDTVDFTTATQDASFLGTAAVLDTTQGPVNFDFWDVGGNIANGVFPVIGTTLKNNKVKFTSAFNTEVAAGAYPGSLTGTTFNWQASFVKNV